MRNNERGNYYPLLKKMTRNATIIAFMLLFCTYGIVAQGNIIISASLII
jgi:hypothetical protein